MGFHAMFYDADNGDRSYDAESFETIFRAFFNSGVSPNGGGLAVTRTGGRRISVAPGLANLDGKVGWFPEAQPFTLDVADASAARYDLVVVRRDDAQRDITVAVKKGTPGGKAPEPVTSGVYELPLALIQVRAGAAEIAETDITDQRIFLTEAVDETVLNGLTVTFNEWFSNLQTQLDGNTAANLQQQITAAKTVADAANTTAAEAKAAATAAGSAASGASKLQIRKIAAFSWDKAESVQEPALLVSQDDLTQLGVGVNDMLLVILRATYRQSAPESFLPLRPGSSASAVAPKADGKKDITRELRWNTSQSTITYRTDKKAKNGNAPVETFGAGLLCLWAKETDKNAGDLFPRFDTENSTYAANQVGTTNAKNQKNNMAYNVYLLPVAVYAVTGVA